MESETRPGKWHDCDFEDNSCTCEFTIEGANKSCKHRKRLRKLIEDGVIPYHPRI